MESLRICHDYRQHKLGYFFLLKQGYCGENTGTYFLRRMKVAKLNLSIPIYPPPLAAPHTIRIKADSITFALHNVVNSYVANNNLRPLRL